MEVLYPRCAGLDVHKQMIVACVRVVVGAKTTRECRTFDTSTTGLQALLAWLTEQGCSHVAMEATGVYWKPVWNILSDGDFELIVANAAHPRADPSRPAAAEDAGSFPPAGGRPALDETVGRSRRRLCSRGRRQSFPPAGGRPALDETVGRTRRR